MAENLNKESFLSKVFDYEKNTIGNMKVIFLRLSISGLRGAVLVRLLDQS